MAAHHNRFIMVHFLSLFLYCIHFLPYGVIKILARPVGFLAYVLLKERRQVGKINLALAFPQKSTYERQLLLQKNFYHLALMFLEYSLCWFAREKRIKRIVRIENIEILQDLSAQGQHVLLLYPHFYALELGALRLNLMYPIISLFTGQKDPVLTKALYKGRTRFNSLHRVHLIHRNQKLISILHLLKENSAPFLYLPDQDFGRKDSIFVPFFSIPTATTTGVSRLSRLTERTVVPLTAIRDKKGIILKVYPPLENFPSEDSTLDTIRINTLIEELITPHPTQYFWLHKRFKTRPEGEIPVY